MDIDLQIATSANKLPTLAHFKNWCLTTLVHLKRDTAVELTIRLVDEDEIRQLNRDYRDKDKPTNVLSFPFEPYDALIAYAGDAADVTDVNLLGDIVIAPMVIVAEAAEQNKTLSNHYAHMTVHAVLHLLGYDHLEDDEAEVMESLEIQILQTLGISNPYQVNDGLQ